MQLYTDISWYVLDTAGPAKFYDCRGVTFSVYYDHIVRCAAGGVFPYVYTAGISEERPRARPCDTAARRGGRLVKFFFHYRDVF